MSAAATAGSLPLEIKRIGIVLVVAVAENGVIGRDNAMPWRIKSDLQIFPQRLPSSKPVIMGRKTYASIGKPLTGRTNIVVTGNSDFAAPASWLRPGSSRRLSAARGDALRRGAAEIAVIGGTEIFLQTMPLADRIELTRVHASPQGDTYMPAIDASALARGRTAAAARRGPRRRLWLYFRPISARRRVMNARCKRLGRPL